MEFDNCVKHNDSFPTKELKNKYLSYLKENERIKVPIETFKSDIEFVMNDYYLIKLQQILALGAFKMVDNNPTNNEFDSILDLFLKY